MNDVEQELERIHSVSESVHSTAPRKTWFKEQIERAKYSMYLVSLEFKDRDLERKYRNYTRNHRFWAARTTTLILWSVFFVTLICAAPVYVVSINTIFSSCFNRPLKYNEKITLTKSQKQIQTESHVVRLAHDDSTHSIHWKFRAFLHSLTLHATLSNSLASEVLANVVHIEHCTFCDDSYRDLRCYHGEQYVRSLAWLRDGGSSYDCGSKFQLYVVFEA